MKTKITKKLLLTIKLKTMKAVKIKSAIYTMIIIFCICANLAQAQWNWGGTPFNNRWGQTNNLNPINTIKSIVVGDFTGNGAIPQAALHVNSNFLTPPDGAFFYPQGNVFTTDCPAGNTTAWRMLKGGTEMGVLFNGAANNNLHIQASEPNSSMIFNTGGANERMRITSDGNVVIGSQGKGLVLKAVDGDNYYLLTVNNEGDLQITLIENEQLSAKNTEVK